MSSNTNYKASSHAGEGWGGVLEVCTASVESVKAAFVGGAQRVELCCALSEDGLTPSAGMIRYALSLRPMKVHVLIRPRGGNFVYTPDEVRCMVQDIEFCHSLGVDGVVTGALTADGDIDLPTCRQLVEATAGMSVTFHRAFDHCRRPHEALEQIISLGCHRLLTSGQAPTAVQGVPLIRQLIEQADGRLIVMPGAGVNPGNAREILKLTGACEIHGSARQGNETHPDIVRQIIENIT